MGSDRIYSVFHKKVMSLKKGVNKYIQRFTFLFIDASIGVLRCSINHDHAYLKTTSENGQSKKDGAIFLRVLKKTNVEIGG